MLTLLVIQCSTQCIRTNRFLCAESKNDRLCPVNLDAPKASIHYSLIFQPMVNSSGLWHCLKTTIVFVHIIWRWQIFKRAKWIKVTKMLLRREEVSVEAIPKRKIFFKSEGCYDKAWRMGCCLRRMHSHLL